MNQNLDKTNPQEAEKGFSTDCNNNSLQVKYKMKKCIKNVKNHSDI